MSRGDRTPRLLVVGGGITGLAAAVELAGRLDDLHGEGAAGGVEVWEAATRLGGKIATSPFAGIDHVDEGADAFLTRVPHAVEFARRVGLDDASMTSPTGAGAAVWHGRLHDIPGGILLGVPASVAPFVTTSLLSWRGKLRAAVEPFLPRTHPDDSIGALIRARFGDEVHDRLVDSLVGSIYATDTDRSSLAAVPQLAALASGHRSLLLGGRAARKRAPVTDAPIFSAPRTGIGGLVDAAAGWLGRRGVKVRTSKPVGEIEPDAGGWRADGERFDAIVLAAPARATAPMVAAVAPEAAGVLAATEYADVIMVRLAVPGDQWPDRLSGRSGYLVPKSQQRLVTAASFASQKWAHWQGAHGEQVIRASLGRDGLPVMHLDDDAVLDATLTEMSGHLGIDLQPSEISITRWHDAFAQYRPHHHERVATIEERMPATLAIAGASYRGIGLPACIADGQRAARSVLEQVVGDVKESTGPADGFLT
ncbi:MAG: protoporphyrinogen oxidase [Ilumatobacter sp.]|uniref:protoporphyrinogen oxidase n=1 Tax=Ilumatobacter sp. TaxID=1967498 RepID=UPI002612F1E4|nr:protoporphyrinogen oxidase [Ilumatobacter sp.]MDJ0770663.1 protoporphyrinogen oxidase [Ilumatobacter sp.]